MEIQDVVRSLDAYIEWVYSTTFDPDSASLVWTARSWDVWSADLSQVLQRSGHGERRNRRNCRKVSVQCQELVMLMVIEKPKDKDETQKCIGIMS